MLPQSAMERADSFVTDQSKKVASGMGDANGGHHLTMGTGN